MYVHAQFENKMFMKCETEKSVFQDKRCSV